MTMQSMRRFFCAWIDVFNAGTRDGCAGYPVSAFTKTAGLITDIRRLTGSRTSGNDQLCLATVMLYPPAVGASGLHRTPRSARYVCLFTLRMYKVSPTQKGSTDVKPAKRSKSSA
jgi:hypothetical protein